MRLFREKLEESFEGPLGNASALEPFKIHGITNIMPPVCKVKSTNPSRVHIRKKREKKQYSNLPRAREYRAGSLLWSIQCAADKTQFSLRREAPHMCRLRYCRDTCQGHELGFASSPPTIREPNGFTPHAVEWKIHCQSFAYERYIRNIKCQVVAWITR